MVARGNGLGSVRGCGCAIEDAAEGAGTYQDCADFLLAWRNLALGRAAAAF